jgi:hypothetical protein
MALRYTTVADLTRGLASYLRTQLIDDAHTGTEDLTLAEAILETAESEVRSRSGGAYEAPTGLDLEDARRLTLALARAEVYVRLDREPSPSLLEAARAAREELTQLVAQRRASRSGTAIVARVGTGSGSTAEDRVWTASTMAGW